MGERAEEEEGTLGMILSLSHAHMHTHKTSTTKGRKNKLTYLLTI
jgi:hypothetical protein